MGIYEKSQSPLSRGSLGVVWSVGGRSEVRLGCAEFETFVGRATGRACAELRRRAWAGNRQHVHRLAGREPG